MLVTNALVLRRSDYRDYDRMVTLISPTHGRLDASARGVKRPKSPLMNATEMFCAGEFTFVSTKAGLTLSQCQINQSYYPIREDYDKLIHATYYAHLLLLAALPEQPCPELFSLALRALAYLSYSDLPNELVTAAFEMHYM
ncbi:DNA repair protein RecO, partial [Eubacteriales bacterium OttesenSCG-928-N13]|nr:DNA repair protein RecO [Eubacteriales bacterium OttesenSCG-928-N13]